jgi:hypothetical protein
MGLVVLFARTEGGMVMNCHNCGTMNSEGTKFCRECGTSLVATTAAAPASRVISSSSAPTIQQLYVSMRQSLVDFGVSSTTMPETMPTAQNLRESLARLGISLSRKQLTGFGASFLAGLIAARILPYIYPIFDPILTAVFGSGPGMARDGFNTNMMTLITFFTSFVLSAVTMLLTNKEPHEPRSG